MNPYQPNKENNLFGQQQNQPGMTFNNPQAQAGAPGFNAGGQPFGTQPATNTFGQLNGSAFNPQQNTTSVFPQSAPTTAFGQQASATPFGQQSTPFGQAPVARPGFGGTTLPAGQGSNILGTSTPFGNSTGTPGLSNTSSLFSSTANKPATPFGQPSSTPFGQSTTTPFGQGNSTPLGQPSSTPFGQSSSTLFGQPSSTPATQPASTPFGQPASTPFGQPSATPFGQSTSTPFGQPTSTPFGQSTSTPFGQTAAQQTPQSGSMIFGQQSAPSTQLGQPGLNSLQSNQNTTQPTISGLVNQSTMPFGQQSTTQQTQQVSSAFPSTLQTPVANTISQPSTATTDNTPVDQSCLMSSIKDDSVNLYNLTFQEIVAMYTATLDKNIKEFRKEAQAVFNYDMDLIKTKNDFVRIQSTIDKTKIQFEEVSAMLDHLEKHLDGIPVGEATAMGRCCQTFEEITDKFYHQKIDDAKDEQGEIMDLLNVNYQLVDLIDKKLNTFQEFK